MLKIGLTGGIASGKSAVADILAELGASIIDTDILARDVVQPGTPGLQEVAEAFGNAVLTPAGELDRRALRAIVFADDNKRTQLEAILHPRIRAATLAAANEAQGPLRGARGATPHRNGFPQIGLIACWSWTATRPTQIERVMARDHCTAHEARQIISSQSDRQVRLAAADDVIDNSGTLQALRTAVATLHDRYLQLASD